MDHSLAVCNGGVRRRSAHQREVLAPVPRLHYTALPPDALEQALTERSEVVARPQRTPRQVLGMWMENAGAGVGVGAVIGVGLYFAGAPEGVLLSGVAAGSIVVWGALMAWRGSADERAMLLSERKVRKAWKLLERDFDARAQRLQAQLERALDALDEADATEAQLRKALDRMTNERDSAMLEKKRALEQAQSANNRNFVRASNTSAQVVADAHEMLRFWFESNGEKWFSRNVSNDFGWSDKRHRAAQKLLVDSGVVVINEKRPRVMEETIDAALRVLNDHVARVDSVYVPDARQSSWDGDE